MAVKKGKKHSLAIGWLYPGLMSTYGDRGNILILTKRCEWRDIDITIIPIDEATDSSIFTTIDAVFGGGAQDREQSIVMNDLKGGKQEFLKKRIEEGMPALFVCGAPQLMGRWYEPGVGERIEGVGIFDMTTIHPGPSKPRLIGNTVAKINWNNISENRTGSNSMANTDYIVGFENHGGRTTLGQNAKPLAEVIVGGGNNGEDKTEGVVYKNAIGTYFHGPLLAKNPHIADWLIKTSLEYKYKTKIPLKNLDDSPEYTAQKAIAKRLGVEL